jgi:hypothetical protein
MNSHITASFRKDFAGLPTRIQDLARTMFALWQQDHMHPSLLFKHLFSDIYSARVSGNYRVLGRRDGDTMIWFWIGSHADYDRKIKRLQSGD